MLNNCWKSRAALSTGNWPRTSGVLNHNKEIMVEMIMSIAMTPFLRNTSQGAMGKVRRAGGNSATEKGQQDVSAGQPH